MYSVFKHCHECCDGQGCEPYGGEDCDKCKVINVTEEEKDRLLNEYQGGYGRVNVLREPTKPRPYQPSYQRKTYQKQQNSYQQIGKDRKCCTLI